MSLPARRPFFSAAILLIGALSVPAVAGASGDEGWRGCAALTDDAARLACFDRWAGAGAATPARAERPRPPPLSAAPENTAEIAPIPGCRDLRQPTLSRFWELDKASSCGTFRIRGYRPLNISLALADGVNRQPSSESPENRATLALPYDTQEMRLQLSVRTKLIEGLLTPENGKALDSLWFGYTQQSYWQLFNPDLSRPFRTTDHEPELIYIHPADFALPGGWRWRYSGLGLVHQSNGRELPYSRSWNRLYLIAGAELDDRWRVQGRLWHRLREKAENDDNPGIENSYGRGELSLVWNRDRRDTLIATARHSLRAGGRGSLRLEWLRTLGEARAESGAPGSALRLHAQLFSGYGDSLIDYNFRRTVFMLGLSLADF